MQVKSIAGAFVIKIFVLFIFERPFYTEFTVFLYKRAKLAK